ncbi:hypothetical protein [Edwardsiella tarda]|uniref:hypothetical protein n=1 Tax=Edwardsiella tarda TaxID=636 RepID=UPI00351C4A68
MNDIKRNVDINVDLETGEIPQLNSKNKGKAVRDIHCSKKIISSNHEMSDWQDLVASLGRRVDE